MPSPTIQQTTPGSSTVGFVSSYAASYGLNVVKGNLLVVQFWGYCSTGVGPITVDTPDIPSGSWTTAVTLDAGGYFNLLAYAVAPNSGAETVTCHFNGTTGGSTYLGSLLQEISGGMIDNVDSSGQDYTAETTSTTATATVNVANSLMIATSMFQYPTLSRGFTGPGVPWTSADILTDSAMWSYQSNPPLGSNSATCSLVNNGGFFNNAVVIKSATYSISGNAGVAGATVSWTGTASGSTTADGSGNYTIPSLANGPYTITPSLTGYTFSPASANETISGSNITGVNFTATANPVGGPAALLLLLSEDGGDS